VIARPWRHLPTDDELVWQVTEGGSASLWSVWSWVTELLLFGVVPLVILVMVSVVSPVGHPRGQRGWSSS